MAGGQLLLSAEDDVLLLHVGGHAVLEEVDRLAGLGPGQVAPGEPGVVAAADGTVDDVEHVVDRTDDDAPAARVGAAALA